MTLKEIKCFIRMNDTPQGDGNFFVLFINIFLCLLDKNE